jgi:hypothetical protein
MEDFYRDVGVVKACGVNDITIFSLDGILDKERLEAFIKGAYDAPQFTPKVSQKVLDNENKNKRLMKIAKAYYKIF